MGPYLLALLLWLPQACIGGQTPFIDITVAVATGMPEFGNPDGLPSTWRTLQLSMADGDMCNLSLLKMVTHTGTHIDAPAHFLMHGHGVEDLDLSVLMGELGVKSGPQLLLHLLATSWIIISMQQYTITVCNIHCA
jgi:kynurenine formamidase